MEVEATEHCTDDLELEEAEEEEVSEENSKTEYDACQRTDAFLNPSL